MDPTEKKRIALITGCSEPLSFGAAIARELLRRGWKVVATARKVETMQELKSAGCETLRLDVVDEVSIREAVEGVKRLTGGRLDLLVNNAGVEGQSPILDIDPSALLDLYNINVVGPLRVVQAFSNMLIRTANNFTDGRSYVVNVGSLGSQGLPWQGAYGSSKAAMEILSDVMRREFGPLGVKVITLELALVKTAMTLSTKSRPYTVSRPSPSPYFPYSVIASKFAADQDKRVASASSPSAVAKQLVNFVEKRNPPGKVWLGTGGWVFKWVWGFLPLRLVDFVFRHMGYVHLVSRPVFGTAGAR